MRSIILPVFALALNGCSLGYYVQSAQGQMDLMSRREPIPALLADPATPETVRSRLAYVQAVRDFASTELLLPDNDSYRLYADLKRDYAVWNVVAAPEFSLEPRTWCFPVAGCVAYRGYFSQEDAERKADELRDEGDDVYVYGVSAYSTLGWFADPILNTMLGFSDAELAGTIFHELAHQQLYVKDDTAFNESFATFVEEEGVRRWLLARNDREALHSWRVAQRREKQFTELLMKTRDELNRLYASDLDPPLLRLRKQEQFSALRERYARLRRCWDGYAAYDEWFDQPLNNAHLAIFGAYSEGVPAFRRLFEENGRDLAAFYAAARRMADQSSAARHEWLSAAGR